MTRRLWHSGAALFLFAIGLWAATDPITGTWKLNLAKSNDAAIASFRTCTARIESSEDGLMTTTDLARADGITVHSTFTAKYDGKDYPITGDPFADAIAMKRVDPTHVVLIWKKAGQIVAAADNVISTDGKTWTETISTKDTQGRDVRIVAVYDKQ